MGPFQKIGSVIFFFVFYFFAKYIQHLESIWFDDMVHWPYHCPRLVAVRHVLGTYHFVLLLHIYAEFSNDGDFHTSWNYTCKHIGKQWNIVSFRSSILQKIVNFISFCRWLCCLFFSVVRSSAWKVFRSDSGIVLNGMFKMAPMNCPQVIWI